MERQTERVANRRQAISDIMQKYKAAKEYTGHTLGEATGIGYGTAKGHVSTTQFNCPNLIHFLFYAELLGPEFVNDVLALAGMTGARRVSKIILCPFQFHAESSQWTAEQAMALADRILDPSEKKKLAPMALERAEANWQFHQFLTGAN